MRLAGRAGLLGAVGSASPLTRLALGGAALVFAIVAIAAMGSAVLTPPSLAACRQGAEPVDVRGLPAGARRYAPLYLRAARRFELGERGPAILAAIHQTESAFGQNMGPSSAGAIGHMQFLPSTWSAYGVDANGDGRKDPYEPADAIFGAANYLRASGAPREWDAAIFAYNHATWYVEEILEAARRFGDLGAVSDATLVCERGSLGAAELERSMRLYRPKGFETVPGRFAARGFGPVRVETRIYDDVVWLLRRYDLVLTAGAEDGHNTHGDGTAIDAVPAESQSLAAWRESAERAARDLGWRPSCARSGVAPVCDLAPAIYAVFYNDFDASHGDPAHSRIPHIHISWKSSSYGTSACCISPAWIDVFPAPRARS